MLEVVEFLQAAAVLQRAWVQVPGGSGPALVVSQPWVCPVILSRGKPAAVFPSMSKKNTCCYPSDGTAEMEMSEVGIFWMRTGIHPS